jgi:tRNA(Ile2) C34 agmatinyltransferase TiaS
MIVTDSESEWLDYPKCPDCELDLIDYGRYLTCPECGEMWKRVTIEEQYRPV